MVDAIVTNFHLPESTLVMMMASFAGREHILAAYEEAVKQKYRFFSFGDAMFCVKRTLNLINYLLDIIRIYNYGY